MPIDSRALGRELFMGWDQVRQLADAGMSVGSHGQSHRLLAGLDDIAQRRELTESKQFLETSIGREVTAVAYPFGWEGTFTARTIELVIEAGYRLAFSSLEGVNRPGTAAFQPFALRRLNVGTGDSPSSSEPGLFSMPRSGHHSFDLSRFELLGRRMQGLGIAQSALTDRRSWNWSWSTA